MSRPRKPFGANHPGRLPATMMKVLAAEMTDPSRLRRGKQFGLVQPSTRTRVDVGINLKDVPPAGRLEASGSFNAMVSHRVRLGEQRATALYTQVEELSRRLVAAGSRDADHTAPPDPR